MADAPLSHPDQDGIPEEEFSRLLGSISTMAPLFKGFFASGGDGASNRDPDPPHHGGPPRHDRHCDKREALLLALKPYLSPARCAAVDYFIRLSRVGDAIRSLQ